MLTPLGKVNTMFAQYRTAIFCGTVFLLLLGAVSFLPPGAVWITDNGNKYIMMRHFAQGGGKVITHEVPELFPTGGFHFVKVPGGAVSFYPPYLSWFSSFFYKAAGERGALFFPVLTTLLLLYLVWKCWKIPPPLLLLCTPLFFYSLLLWEMTPGVFLTVGAFLLIEKKFPFAAGAVLGISLLMREEAYFAGAACGGAFLFTKRWSDLFRFSGGFLCAALPLWGYQWIADGHFLGVHGKNYYVNNNAEFSLYSQCKVALFNLYHHLLRFDSWGSSTLNYLAFSALLLPCAGAASRFRNWKKFKYAALGIYLCSMALLAAGAWFQKNVIYTASLMTGLLTATPLISGALLNWRALLRWRTRRFLLWVSLLYILCVPLLMTASDVGLVWGARHFLLLLPVLIFLSFDGFCLMAGKKLGKRLFCAAALLSAVIQLYGLFALYRISTDSHVVEQKILGRSEKVIVTDVFYIPEQMPRLFFEKTVLQLITADDVKQLKKYMASQKEKEFLLLLSPQFRRMNDVVLKELLDSFPLTEAPKLLSGKGGFPALYAGNCALTLPQPRLKK